jgi:hypothetical protein
VRCAFRPFQVQREVADLKLSAAGLTVGEQLHDADRVAVLYQSRAREGLGLEGNDSQWHEEQRIYITILNRIAGFSGVRRHINGSTPLRRLQSFDADREAPYGITAPGVPRGL